MTRHTLTDPDTTHRSTHVALTLRATRYYLTPGGPAELSDDGIIDPVAVERFVNGDNVRITPREMVCIVAELAARGMSDAAIGDRFGRVGDRGAEWAFKVRTRNRIAAAVPTYDDDQSARLILDRTARAFASHDRLAAAGVTWAAA